MLRVLPATAIFLFLGSVAIVLGEKERPPLQPDDNRIIQRPPPVFNLVEQSAAGAIGRMVLIEGGTFTRSDPSVPSPPTQRVTLSPFYIGATEVTRGEFSAFVNATGYRTKREMQGRQNNWRNCWNMPQNDSHPVICIGTEDAAQFCNWKSQREQLRPVFTFQTQGFKADWTANGYRLPSEAEWEFAARARGNAGDYWSGTASENNLAEYAWYLSSARNRTHAVASLKPNAYNLYDLTGNVSELVYDTYCPYSRNPETNPHYPSDFLFSDMVGCAFAPGPPAGRGGSWYTITRINERGWFHSGPAAGFRLARNR